MFYRILAVCVLLSLLGFSAPAPPNASTPSLDAQTPAEQEVLRQLSAGKEADLTKLPQGQRTVRAAFLKQLLSASSQGQGGSLTLIGAEIPDAFLAGGSNESMDVPMNLKLENCHFAAAFQCNGCHFHASVAFHRCRFDDGLHLQNSQVDGDMLLTQNVTEVQAKEKAHAVFLRGSHVTGLLSIQQPRGTAVSIGAANTSAGNIDINLTDSGRVRILNLANVSTGHLTIFNNRPGSSHLKTLYINAVNVKNNLFLKNLAIEDLTARHITVGFQTEFSNLAITNQLNLSAATLDSFAFALASQNDQPVWPKEIELDDFSFKSGAVTADAPKPPAKSDSNDVQPADETPLPRDVTLEFLERANYSQSAFTSYETELTGEGRSHDAQEVFTQMHRARRRSDFKLANPATWLTTLFDYFQEYFLGYGRSVVPPLVWSLVFIALGTLLFRGRDSMVAMDDKAPPFSPFWYSLETFLPVVDLGVGKSWRPRPSSPLVTYARLHQLAGWILIPVALAAITGVVK